MLWFGVVCLSVANLVGWVHICVLARRLSTYKELIETQDEVIETLREGLCRADHQVNALIQQQTQQQLHRRNEKPN